MVNHVWKQVGTFTHGKQFHFSAQGVSNTAQLNLHGWISIQLNDRMIYILFQNCNINPLQHSNLIELEISGSHHFEKMSTKKMPVWAQRQSRASRSNLRPCIWKKWQSKTLRSRNKLQNPSGEPYHPASTFACTQAFFMQSVYAPVRFLTHGIVTPFFLSTCSARTMKTACVATSFVFFIIVLQLWLGS